MKFRFLTDRHNGKPHVTNRHAITVEQVIDAFTGTVHREYSSPDGSRERECTGDDGKKMNIVYRWDVKGQEVFIVTAYYI